MTIHCLCNCHQLRELEAVAKLDGEPWAGEMQDLLLEMLVAVNAVLEEGDKAVDEATLSQLVQRYRDMLDKAIAHYDSLPPLPTGKRGRQRRRKGHNLALRLRDREEAVLRFLNEPGIPFTNNLAELAMRMVKVQQKISGCFRSMAGARNFAVLRSVLDTARKQKWDLLDTLACSSESLIAKLVIR